MRRSARSSTCCPRSRASASTTRSSISRPPRCRSWTAARRRSCSCSHPPASKSRAPPKRFVRVRKRVEVGEGDKWVRLDPHDGFRVNVEIDFDHPALRKHRQSMTMDFSTSTFLKEISRARTFGFLKDLETSRKLDRALGGSLDNAIVMDDYRVLNEDGLRFRDEFVRHKVLDALGDLYLVGAGLIARVQRLQVRPPAQQSAAAAVARAARLLRGSRVRRGARAALAGFLPARDRTLTRRLALSRRAARP